MKSTSILRVGAVALFALALASCGDDGPDAASTMPGGGPMMSGGSMMSGGGAAAAAPSSGAATTYAPGDTVEFVATDLMFTPSTVTAEPGTYQGVLVNDGAIAHDITFEGADAVVAQPGERVEFQFTVPDGGTTFMCSVPGHADAGMRGTVTTPGAATTATTAPAADSSGHGGTAATTVEADPNAPAYELRDPTAPQRGEGDGITLVPGGAPGGGDLIEVEMVVEEKLMTIAEGFQQQVWTFNGQMPGPVIRAQVGDTIRVHLVNPPESALSHSVDFHASQVAWNDEMRSIAPGEDLVYEFTADYAGVWMYHCGTAPVLHHIANGMFGMVIVEPEGGLAPVDQELFVVQDDWYLGPQGQPSSLDKANQAAPAPDFVMFNGVASQYADNPIQVATGSDVRVFVLDAGPSIDSSFHIVGTVFNDVIKEGVHLSAGNDGNWGSQAVDLSPAQGAIVQFRTAEDGLYPMVTHAFNFPGRGAVGMIQSGDGQP